MLPSASSTTTKSPVARSKPVRMAAPLPRPSCETTTTSDRASRAASTVRSREKPSTRTTSSTQLGMPRRTQPMLRASFRAGTTTLTVGLLPTNLAYAVGQPFELGRRPQNHHRRSHWCSPSGRSVRPAAGRSVVVRRWRDVRNRAVAEFRVAAHAESALARPSRCRAEPTGGARDRHAQTRRCRFERFAVARSCPWLGFRSLSMPASARHLQGHDPAHAPRRRDGNLDPEAGQDLSIG